MADVADDRELQPGKIPALVAPAGNQPDRVIDTLKRFQRRIDVRPFRIVDESNAAALSHQFQRMLESGERRHHATDHLGRAAPERRVGDGSHDILHVMMTQHADVAPPANLLARTGHCRHDHVAVEIGASVQIGPELLPSGEAQAPGADMVAERRNAGVVEVEESEIRSCLILEYALLGREIFIDGVIAVLVIDRHVEDRSHPGMKLIDGLQLKTGNFHRQIVEGFRLALFRRLQGRPGRFAQRRSKIPADECPLPLLGQHFPDERHGGALSVCAGHGKNRGGDEPGRQLELADHLDPAPSDTFERLHAVGDTRTDDHEIGVIQ